MIKLAPHHTPEVIRKNTEPQVSMRVGFTTFTYLNDNILPHTRTNLKRLLFFYNSI